MPVRAPGVDLDVAWWVGFHMALRDGLQFGTEVIWSRGPLSVLDTYNVYVYHDTWLASLLFSYVLHFLFVGLLFLALQPRPTTPRVYRLVNPLLFLLLVLLSVPVAPIDDKLLLAAAMLLTFSAASNSPEQKRHLLSVLAGILLGLVSLMKFSSLLVAAAQVVVFVTLQARRRRAYAGIYLLITYVAVLFSAWIGTGQNLQNLLPFVRNSWQVVAGFSSAQAFSGPPLETLIGGLSALGATFALVYAWMTDCAQAKIFLALTWVHYGVMFKMGFVRHDAHAWLYFSFAAIFWAIVLARLPTNGRAVSRRVVSFVVLLLVLNVGGQYWQYRRIAKVWWPGGILQYRASLGDAWRLLTDAAFRAHYEQQAKRNLLRAFGVEPGQLRQRVGDETIDIFPWEDSIAWAEGLRWSPRPAFQSYTAYTPALDALNAGHFRGGESPRWILWRWNKYSTEGKYGLFDEPETFRTVLCHYRYADQVGDLILLERVQDQCGSLYSLGNTIAQMGERIRIPSYEGGYVFGRVNTHLTPSGTLKKLLLRAGRLRIAFPELDESYRLSRRVAPDGLFLSTHATTPTAFIDLFSGTMYANVEAFVVDPLPQRWDFAEWGQDYSPTLDVAFFALPTISRPLLIRNPVIQEPAWNRMEKVQGGAGGVDLIGTEPFRGEKPQPLVIRKRPHRTFRIEGWAADTLAKTPGRGVFLILENRARRIVLPTRRVPRPDVVQAYDAPAYGKSGYVAVAWTPDVPDGCYRVTVRVLASASKTYYELPTKWVCFWEY